MRGSEMFGVDRVILVEAMSGGRLHEFLGQSPPDDDDTGIYAITAMGPDYDAMAAGDKSPVSVAIVMEGVDLEQVAIRIIETLIASGRGVPLRDRLNAKIREVLAERDRN